MTFLNRNKKLWKDGQTNLAYVTPEHSLSREKRFKLYSIYWPQKNETNVNVNKKQSEVQQRAHKISKLIDQEEKNELRMGKGRATSQKKINQKKGNFGKDGLSTFRETTATILSKENQQIMKRLTFHSHHKQSKLRDRHGHRTNIFENEQNDFLMRINEKKDFKASSTGFNTARRMKLDLPHNYYPGPGSYQIKRYLEDRKNDKITSARQ